MSISNSNINKSEEYLRAANGEGQFYIRKSLVDEPKAVAVILHDLISHGERYCDLTKSLNENNIDVLIPDIVGFGMSKQGHPGAFAMKSKGIDYVIEDIEYVFNLYDEKYGRIPHILISDGKTNVIASLYVRTFDNIDAMVNLGCMQHFNVNSAMVAAAKSLVIMKGYHSVSNAIINMTEAPAFHGVEEANKYYWLSSIDTEIERFINDVDCGIPIAASSYLDIFAAEKYTSKLKWLRDFPNIPILLMAGSDDIMGNYGKAAKDMMELLEETNHDFLLLKIYSNCRHDLLHDRKSDEVINDLVSWINVALCDVI